MLKVETFSKAVQSSQGTTSAVFRVDWDKDGYPDLLVGEKGIRFFQGSPDGKQREVVGHSTFAGIQAGRGDAYPVAADS